MTQDPAVDPNTPIVVSPTTVLVESQELAGLRGEFESQLWELVREHQDDKDDRRQMAQKLISDYIMLYGPLTRAKDADQYLMALFGLSAFSNGLPVVSARVARELNFSTSTSAALSEIMRGLSYFMAFVLVLAYALISILSYLLFRENKISLMPWSPEFLSEHTILLAAAFGCLGSVVSLLLRLGEFETMRGRSRNFLFYTGLTLPIVGVAFATVIAALFDSQIIGFSLSGGGGQTAKPSWQLFILIGFLSGFSERFSRNLLTSMENRLSGTLDRNAQSARVEISPPTESSASTEGVRRAQKVGRQPKSVDRPMNTTI